MQEGKTLYLLMELASDIETDDPDIRIKLTDGAIGIVLVFETMAEAIAAKRDPGSRILTITTSGATAGQRPLMGIQTS